jgi:hypothetical protein
MDSSSQTPLEKVREWPEELVRQLKRNWITTAEQVVAVSATPGGISSLAEQLDLPKAEVERLVSAARTALPPHVVSQLEAPVDASHYGLGALEPSPGRTPE